MWLSGSLPGWHELPLWARGVGWLVGGACVAVTLAGTVLNVQWCAHHASLYHMYWTLKRQYPEDPDLQSYNAWHWSLLTRYVEWMVKLDKAGFLLTGSDLELVDKAKRVQQQEGA